MHTVQEMNTGQLDINPELNINPEMVEEANMEETTTNHPYNLRTIPTKRNSRYTVTQSGQQST